MLFFALPNTNRELLYGNFDLDAMAAARTQYQSKRVIENQIYKTNFKLCQEYYFSIKFLLFFFIIWLVIFTWN